MSRRTPDPKDRKPLHLLEPDVSRGIVERFQLMTLLGRFHDRHVWAAFMFINGFITIGSLALLAMVTRTPFVFPSLGPTAFLFFFTPTLPTASPRNTIYGHALGIACGYGALLACGLTHAPPVILAGGGFFPVLPAPPSLSFLAALIVL